MTDLHRAAPIASHEVTAGQAITRPLAAGRAVFVVECASASIRDAVERLFVDLPPAVDDDHAVRIRFFESEDGRWTTVVSDEWRHATLTPGSGLGALVSVVSRLALDADPDRLHLHCAALARDDAVLLIAGQSGTGKSTLAAKLALEGWSYLTDECVALTCEDRSVSAFPKPLVLKPGGGDLLPELQHRRVRIGDEDDSWWNLPASEIPVPIRQCGRPTTVVLLDRGPDGFDAQPHAARIHPADAVVALMGHTMDAARFGGNAMLTLTRLAASSRCERVLVGELQAEAEMLDAMVSDSAPAAGVTELPGGANAEQAETAVTQSVRSLLVGDRAVVHDVESGTIVALDEAGSAVWSALHGSPPGWWDDTAMSTPGTRLFLDQLAAHGLVQTPAGSNGRRR